jgi:hypothetical protein
LTHCTKAEELRRRSRESFPHGYRCAKRGLFGAHQYFLADSRSSGTEIEIRHATPDCVPNQHVSTVAWPRPESLGRKMVREPDALDPSRRSCPVSPSPNVVETARKRAVLLTNVASHLARYRIALKALADFERRHQNVARAATLKDIFLSLDDTNQRFGIDADDAHARWVNLRRLSESQ